jgi:hypothetical protein
VTRTYTIAALSCLLALPTEAIAKESKCLSREELRTGIAYIMPAIVSGVVTKCSVWLPSDSYLTKNGTALVTRYAGQSQGTENDVRALFDKFGNQAGLDGVDGQSTAKLVESLVTVGIQSEMKPEICADITTVMALLDPLPAENMNGLIEFVLVKVDNGNASRRTRTKSGKNSKIKDANNPRSKPFLCDTLALNKPSSE